ncbi:MAG: efflux RND transporter periplasmic adaptor subunit [Bacteroidales bacterium]|nr:efflux RND transporter periplasmic adaptor subunit [Bacteroidales bacterium]
MCDGEVLYEVADLSKVWALFDVYESDMPWIKKEIPYHLRLPPARRQVSGTISYIDPVIDPATHVAKARAEVTNEALRLKPEMFVRGATKSELSEEPALVVPASAVMWTGKRSVVYVKNATEQEVSFMMREVTLGSSLGDRFVITEGLQQGEEIAVSGTFSIDAAAQLAGKPAMMNRGRRQSIYRA